MAVDRKQQMKEITERLEQGVKDIFTSEMYTTYLRTMAKFHNYSFNNTLLIAMQRPDATLVAGFNAWKNKFNRYVKKGEKGIQIIAPAPIKEVEEREKINKDTGLAVLNENGEPEMERVEYVVPRFRVTTVFDVSQTDGEPIPSLEVNELTASVKDYALLTVAIEQVSPVPIRFDEIEGEAKGYYSDIEKEICIQVGMGESQTIKTMIHEVAHAMLHNSDLMKQRGEEKDRLTKETEAESIAFTVCSALGIDTSDYSFPYVASWASGKEMRELKDSMDTIRLTAADFLEKLETAVAERSAERMTAIFLKNGICRIRMMWYRRLLKRLRLCRTTAHRIIRMCLSTMSRSAMPKKMTRWIFSIGSIRKFAMCWNIAVVFRQQKRRKVQYEVCKLYPDTSLEEPSR